MSHHHGIGKAFAPWLEGEMGSLENTAPSKPSRNTSTPKGIMNPGGTLGLDLTKEQKIAKDEPLKDIKL
jgi:alkyldihydroxyacetonephosphate synthase